MSGDSKTGQIEATRLEIHDFAGNQRGYHLGTVEVDAHSAHVWRWFFAQKEFLENMQEMSCKKSAVLYYRDSENMECTPARGVQPKKTGMHIGEKG